jgi:hypothetical protein
MNKIRAYIKVSLKSKPNTQYPTPKNKLSINLKIKPMAIIQNYINTKDKEKSGNVQCYKLNGQYILRTVPYDPKTPAQLAHKMGFKKLSFLIHQVIDHINIAYKGLRKGHGFNAYAYVMGINIKRCFADKRYVIDPCLLVLCDNDGSFVSDVILSSSVENTITGVFKSNAQNDEEGDDPVRAYGFDAEGNKIWQFDQSAKRSTGTITLTRSEMTGLTIGVYFECLDRISLVDGNPKHIIKYVGSVKVL